VNRTCRQGFCGETADLRLAAASIHRGEEPPVTGRGGSGTIFVSGCGLGCVFCQNYQISGKSRISQKVNFSEFAAMGRLTGTEEFARIGLTLEAKGAENINIVTGSHAIPVIAAGIDAAREAGLAIPVLWNSSAYESPDALELLEGRIDGWLPDLKTLDPALANRFFRAPDYPDAARAALLKMLETGARVGTGAPAGSREASSPGLGVPLFIIRHLVLPGFLDSTRQVLRWFADHAAGRAQLSLMTQYTPVKASGAAGGPDRYLGRDEYNRVLDWLEEFGIEEGFCQEPVPESDWLPDFTRLNPFPSALSIPVWHWKEGFV
jgi:putative pyruvate formate lyase activating enzyme